MNMKATRRVALAGLLTPVAIGLFAACSSGTAGHAGMADSSAARVAGADASTAGSQALSSGAVPSTASGGVRADGSAAETRQSDGSGGAVNHGSLGSAAGAAGIGTQTGPASAQPSPRARLKSFSLTEPSVCPSGGAVTPAMAWDTADATGVGVSVDRPDIVADFGTFGTSGTLALPAVACSAAPGTTITHRYDVWALGPGEADHRTVTLKTTVKVILKPPLVTLSPKPTITLPPKLPTLTVKPTITLPPKMPTLTVKPTITLPPKMPTLTVKPTPPPFPPPVVPINPAPIPGP